MKIQTTEQKIYYLVCEITGKKPLKANDKKLSVSVKLLEQFIKKNATSRSVNTRIMECIDVLQSYSRLKFNSKVRLLKTGDHLNALALGINMLGEELNASTISLREKETFLKEIHHRVKNNLQIISSLLSLQSNHANALNSDDIFREARARIKSIGLVHEYLYESADSSNIDTEKYAENLIQHIQSIFDPLKKIRVTTKFDKIFLHIDQAIPLGLIINEFLTNTYKYAFKSNKNQLITVRIINSGTGKKRSITLEVIDNGIGFPAGFNTKKLNSLGLNLVAMLAEQLNGKMTAVRKKSNTILSVVFLA